MWTSGGGIHGLGWLPGYEGWSDAVAISSDGSTIVGGNSGPANYQGFLWTHDLGMVGLGFLPNAAASPIYGFPMSVATGVSQLAPASLRQDQLWRRAGRSSGAGL
jgi:hypothetical protein